jgi:hypothetical protein
MSDSTSFTAQVNRLNVNEQLVRLNKFLHCKMHQLTSEQSGETAPSELVATVDDLLNQLSSKFSNLSSEMIAKSKIA